jgi:Glycosyltransferase
MSLVYSGRLIPEKGLVELIEAFAEAKAAKNSYLDKLHIIGTGRLLHDLAALVEDYALEGEVIFHGEVLDDTEIGHIYRQCVASVCCGYLGLNVIQSLAHGLPIIFNARANHSPEIEACVDGFNSVRYETSEELVELMSNISKIVASTGKTLEIHDHVRKNYDTDLMASRFADFVDMICGS